MTLAGDEYTQVRILFELSAAYEEWICEVPKDANLSNLTWDDIQLYGQEDSGWLRAELAQVWDEEGNEHGDYDVQSEADKLSQLEKMILAGTHYHDLYSLVRSWNK